MQTENVKKISATKLITDSGFDDGLFLGKVISTKPVTTAFGTSLKLVGAFQLRLRDGKIISSNIAYVPEVVQNIVSVAMASVEDATKFSGVEIACRLYKKDNPKSVTKYEWAYESVIAPSAQVDPLAHLIKDIPPALLNFTAPKPLANSAPAPEDTKAKSKK